MRDLGEKNVLITGAASGIGRACARAFAGEGANLILADIDEEGLAEVGREIEAAGIKVVCVIADISSQEDVKALVGKAMGEMGGVDVLVNNAGICQVGAAEDLGIEDWERMIGVNLLGAIYLTHEILPEMIERGSGHIVNIASGAGLVGFPNMAPYCTTKFALVGLSEALGAELASHNIKVTVVCPGVINTPIIRKSEIRGFENLEDRISIVEKLGMSPEKAARIIIRGVKTKRPVVIITAPMKILAVLKRFFPGISVLLMRILARRMSLDRAKKS